MHLVLLRGLCSLTLPRPVQRFTSVLVSRALAAGGVTGAASAAQMAAAEAEVEAGVASVIALSVAAAKQSADPQARACCTR